MILSVDRAIDREREIVDLRSFLKSHFGFLRSVYAPVRRKAHHLSLTMKSPQQIFTTYYHNNTWKDDHSYSGTGSNLAQTEAVRTALPHLIKEHNCVSFLDIPCGDFFWMRTVNLPHVEYLGADIVSDLIVANQASYGNDHCRFTRLDLIHDPLPTVDMIFCRDCLVHLSFAHIFLALKNIKASGSHYLLTTTFVEKYRNQDIVTGLWRPLNLQISPFNFPAPIKVINEANPTEEYKDKSLGLWRVADIPLPP